VHRCGIDVWVVIAHICSCDRVYDRHAALFHVVHRCAMLFVAAEKNRRDKRCMFDREM
jgi:hypothetical protein